jgi:predicted O-methyltransferase YrrM
VFQAAENQLADSASCSLSLNAFELPPSDGWNLSWSTRALLVRILGQKKPDRIVEFGCGVSTLIFANHARLNELSCEFGPPIVSFEHDPEWHDKTRTLLESRGLSRFVELILAPLVPLEDADGHQLGYQWNEQVKQILASRPGFDLCFIDGPPGRIGRGPCLPRIAPYLSANAFVMLDDSYRIGEQEIWIQWTRQFSHSLIHSRLAATDRGVAMGTWKRAGEAAR